MHLARQGPFVIEGEEHVPMVRHDDEGSEEHFLNPSVMRPGFCDDLRGCPEQDGFSRLEYLRDKPRTGKILPATSSQALGVGWIFMRVHEFGELRFRGIPDNSSRAKLYGNRSKHRMS